MSNAFRRGFTLVDRHYYGILGPKGTNTYANTPYKCTDEAKAYGDNCTQGTSGFPRALGWPRLPTVLRTATCSASVRGKA